MILSPDETQEFEMGALVSVTVYPPGGQHLQITQRGTVLCITGLTAGRALIGIGRAGGPPDADFVTRRVEVEVTA